MTPLRARVLLVASAALWGLQFVANHELLEVIDSADIVVIRFTGVVVALAAGVVLIPALRPPRMRARDVVVLAIAGALAVPGAQLLLLEGQRYLAPAMTGLVAATGPAITALLAALFLGERLTIPKLVGTVVALVGSGIVVVMASGVGTELTVRNPWGAALVLGAQISFAAYTIITKTYSRRMLPMQLLVVALVLGTVWLLPLLPSAVASAGALSGLRWLWFVQLIVGGTLLPYAVWNLSLTVLPANETASSLYLVPLFGILWSWSILREDLSLAGLAGGALIVAGVALTQVGGHARAAAPVVQS